MKIARPSRASNAVSVRAGNTGSLPSGSECEIASLDRVLAACDAVTNGEGVFGSPWDDKVDTVVRAALPLSIILDQDPTAFERVANHPSFPKGQRAPNKDAPLLAMLFTTKPRNGPERGLASDWTNKLQWAQATGRDPAEITLKQAKAEMRAARRAGSAQARASNAGVAVTGECNPAPADGSSGAEAQTVAPDEVAAVESAKPSAPEQAARQLASAEVMLEIEMTSKQAAPALDLSLGGLGLAVFEHVAGGKRGWTRLQAVGPTLHLPLAQARRAAALALLTAGSPPGREAKFLRALADAFEVASPDLPNIPF